MNDQLYIDLLRAIRAHSGLELASIRDAGTHGADAGWAGFTYTSDGDEFFQANRDAVWAVLEEDASGCGYASVPAFVASFGRVDMAESADGFGCLLAWYALERVGQHMIDRREAR